MSKQQKVERIKEVILSKEKPRSFMKIFILKGKGVEPKFYKSIPSDLDINVNCPNVENADKLIQFLEKLQNAASKNPIITGINIIRDE